MQVHEASAAEHVLVAHEWRLPAPGRLAEPCCGLRATRYVGVTDASGPEKGMAPAELEQARAALDLTRQRRELFFWTIEMSLVAIVLIAMTIAFVVWLAQGVPIGVEQLVAGAGVGAVGARAKQLLAALNRTRAVEDNQAGPA